MKTTVKILVVLALALAFFGTSITASAAPVFRNTGVGADGFFYSESGCVSTDVGLFPRDQTFRNPPGPGDQGSFLFLYISQYDFCAGQQVMYAEGFTGLAEDDFQGAKRLDWATLTTTVNVFDYVSGTSFDVYIDVNWTAIGPAIRQNSHYHFHAPGCNYNSQYKENSRDAEVTGSVSDGITNFTPETGWGRIFSFTGKDVFAGCN
jgi:hypothetical protein